MAVANGYRLFPLLSGQQRRVDPDFGEPAQLKALAKLTGVLASQLSALDLASYHGVVFDAPRSGRSHPRWIVPLRYSLRQGTRGASYCPACLRSDVEPFFRRTWRLGFVCDCAVHGTEMIDRCPGCDMSVWPSSSFQTAFYRTRAVPLWQCPACLLDLRLHIPVNARNAVAGQLEHIVRSGTAMLGQSLGVPAIEFLDALAAIAHLFMRHRSRQVIAGSGRWKDCVAFATSSCNVIEQLPLPVRRPLVAIAYGLLDDWPHRFLAFADETGLQRQHFSGSESLSPAWMMSLIGTRLSSQVRGVSAVDVDSARRSLVVAGRMPTIAAVNEALGSKNAKAVRDALGRRRVANDNEFGIFLGALQMQINSQPSDRLSQRMDCRNTVIALCLLKSGRDHSFLQLPFADLVSELDWAVSSSNDCLAELACTALHRIDSTSSTVTGALPLRPYRGRNPSMRAVAELVSRCMSSLDARLLRNLSVFRAVAIASAGPAKDPDSLLRPR